MLLTLEWKLDILLQNQTEKQQSNTMIHKIEVDLIEEIMKGEFPKNWCKWTFCFPFYCSPKIFEIVELS